jgi:hypothetical protein
MAKFEFVRRATAPAASAVGVVRAEESVPLATNLLISRDHCARLEAWVDGEAMIGFLNLELRRADLTARDR